MNFFGDLQGGACNGWLIPSFLMPGMLPFDGGLNQKQYRVVKNLGIAAGSGEVSEAFAAEVQGLMGVPPLKSQNVLPFYMQSYFSDFSL